jgi:hypothetical protein
LLATFGPEKGGTYYGTVDIPGFDVCTAAD